MMRISEMQYKIMKGAKPGQGGRRAFYAARLPKRADKNQPDIVRTLRQLGFMVSHLHEVGSGMFDLIAAKHGLNILVEVKDGLKPPSARELTRPQKRFHFSWTGMRCIVTCAEDCRRLNDQVNAIGKLLQQHAIALNVTGSQERMYEPSLH